jgi:AAA15 family ATPase/GTPase
MSNSIKIDKIYVKNYKGITEAELAAGGNHVIVYAPNGMGKTTFLDFCLGTCSKVLSNNLTHPRPSEMIRNGAETMEGTIVLTDGYEIQVKGKHRKDKQEMSVMLLRDGVEQKAPRALMDELFGVVNFDIDSFVRMSDKEQMKFYMQLINLDLTDLDTAYSRAFKERTDVNRDLKRFEDEVSAMRMKLIGKDKPARLDMNEMTASRASVEATQKEHDRIANLTKDFRHEQALRQSLIEEARANIQKWEAEMAEFQNKATKGETWLANNERPELDDVSALVTQVYENNLLVDQFDELEKKIALLEETRKEQQELNNTLADVEEQKRARLANAVHPVPGMEVTEDGLRLNGVPFVQVNTAQKIMAGLQMQMPLMGKARMARFVADSLDANTMQQIGAMAEANNLQLFVEQVDRSAAASGLQFEIRERL